LEFWDKERFKNRSLKIFGGPEAVSIPVPDNVVLCDFCSVQITEFPVPVYLGNALCQKCFAEQIKEKLREGYLTFDEMEDLVAKTLWLS